MSIKQAVLEAMSPEQIIRLKKVKAWLEPLPEYHDRTQSIFIHIPKAAGMSMVSALYGMDSSVHDTWREYYRRSTSNFKAYFKCRSEEHTSELKSLMRISSYAFCLKK